MAVTLRVESGRWRAHLAATVAAFPGLVPVVKGNGYGFGRARLATVAASLGVSEVAVGTVHELAEVPSGALTRIVLTPALGDELAGVPADVVLTVGSVRHVDEAIRAGAAHGRRMIVKLRTSMGRYGVPPGELDEVMSRLASASASIHGVAAHPPLAGTGPDHAAEVADLLAGVPEDVTAYVSHLDDKAYTWLREQQPRRQWRIRLGTVLWHGDKSFLHLGADVLDVRPVRAGERAGYRLGEIPVDGHLVLVSAGTAHGVHALDDSGRSPFHFQRRRLPLLEPPHMHTSMVLAGAGDPVPAIGDEVDVQRPLTQTIVDRVTEQ
jgi:alanine racemase